MNLSPKANLNIVTILLGVVVSSLGVIVVFGWFTHQPGLIQFFTEFKPMQFNVALGFFLSGAGILFAALGMFRYSCLCGGLVSVVGSLTLLEYIFGFSFGIDEIFIENYLSTQTSHPGRMAPNTALCFTLTGIALIAASSSPIKIRFNILEILGPIILGLSNLALFVYLIQLDPTNGWGGLTRMPVHTAFGFSLIGIIFLTLTLSVSDRTKYKVFQRLPIALGIGTIIVSIFLWKSLHEKEESNISLKTKVYVENIKRELREAILHRTFAIKRMVERWKTNEGTSKKKWEAYALNYISEFNEFTSVQWIAPSYTTQWIVPKEKIKNFKNYSFYLNSHVRNSMNLAQELRRVTFTTPAFLPGEKIEFWLIAPIFVKENFQGFMVVSINSSKFFQQIFQSNSLFRQIYIEIFDTDQLIYKTSIDVNSTRKERSIESFLSLPGATWQIRIKSTSSLLNDNLPFIPEVTLFLGFLISTLLSSAAWATRIAQDRTKEANLLKEISQNKSEELKQSLEMLEKKNRAHQILSFTNQAISRSENENQLLTEICRICGEIGGYPLAWVGFAGADPEKTIQIVAKWSRDKDHLEGLTLSWGENERGKGPSGVAIREAAPICINEKSDDDAFAYWRLNVAKWGYQSSFHLPLLDEGKAFGVLAIYSGEGQGFDDEEKKIFEELSNDLSFGIQVFRDREKRRRAEEGTQNYLERLKALNDLSKKITGTLKLDEVLQFVSDTTSELLRIPWIAIFRKKDNKLVVVSKTGDWWSEDETLEFQIGTGGSGKVAETGNPVYIENIQEDPDWIADDWQKENGFQSYLGIPLRSEDEVIGVLSCLCIGERKFSPDDLRLLATIAGTAGSAIQNAEKHQQLQETLSKLQKSQQMIIRAEKLSSIGTLTAGAAHEILNPANIIGMHAQRMLMETEEGSREYKSAETIHRNVERISRICDDLRRFSRDEKPQQETFDPNHTVLNCLHTLEHELRLHNIQAEIKLDENTPLVTSDENQLQQVFFNLISNAVDAMPDGGKLIVSSKDVMDEDQTWWEIQIEDTGMGIPEEVIEKIFDPFFTTKPEDKGTGLGLSVSYGIVESQGGKIWVDSKPNEGTTFFVRLPVPEKEYA